jgi:hypothetical protein
MEAGLDDRTLRRIIALLVALAGLAERAAGRCFPARFIVLLVLRRAEALSRDLVLALAPPDWPCPNDAPDPGSCPVAATRLALRLSLLAALLSAMLDPPVHRGRTERRIDRAPVLGGGASRLVDHLAPAGIAMRIHATGPPDRPAPSLRGGSPLVVMRLSAMLCMVPLSRFAGEAVRRGGTPRPQSSPVC